jgi:hypothetical protein
MSSKNQTKPSQPKPKPNKSTKPSPKTSKQPSSNPVRFSFRPTIFQAKVVLSLVLLVWSFSYYQLPLTPLHEQTAYALIILSIFVLMKPSPYHQLMRKFSRPMLFSVLIYLAIILPLLLFANTKYHDWDNAQMIKGLAKDFPALVRDIEQETGLDLDIKNDCMTTSEKFSSGVRTCEVSVAKATEKGNIDKAINII